MAIIYIVETGEGLDDATAYAEIQDVSTYLESSGGATDEWTLATDTRREQAIIEASNYIDNIYGLKFSGTAKSVTQGLEYPRVNALFKNRGIIPSDSVPKQIVSACAILAERSLLGNLYTLNETGADQYSSLPVKSVKAKVSSVEESKTFAVDDVNISFSDAKQHKDVYNILKPLLYNTKLLLRG